MLSIVAALVSILIFIFAGKELDKGTELVFLLILNAAAKKPLKRDGLVSLLIFAADERS